MAYVRALLASAPGAPAGDVATGMELRMCLTPSAQMDATAFDADPLPWPVRRFWPDREEWRGQILRVDGRWAVRSARGDDEPLWEMSVDSVRPGDYLTLHRPDGEELVFRIVNVDPD